MSDHIYKKIELTGSSTVSIEDAIKKAVLHAGKTLRNMRWFEVKEIRGQIDDQEIAYWQVTIQVGFRVE
jgi:flavin-binding protein dodecin